MPFKSKAELLTKNQVEKGADVFVWDSGSKPGLIDPEDILTDFDSECKSISIRDFRVLLQTRSSLPTKEIAISKIVAAAGLTDFNFTSTIVDAFSGETKNPIFFIYPEVHLDQDKSGSSLILHESRTKEMLSMTLQLLKNKKKIYNAIEGPKGYWTSSLNSHDLTDIDREKMSTSLVRDHFLSAGSAIAEMFLDTIPTSYVDEPGMNVRSVVALIAKNIVVEKDFNPQADYFPLVQAWFVKQGAESLIEKYELKTYFQMLMSKSATMVTKEATDLCESRSLKMVENAIIAANSYQSEIIFLQTGSLHVHGVVTKLKKLGIGYVVLSPNMSSH